MINDYCRLTRQAWFSLTLLLLVVCAANATPPGVHKAAGFGSLSIPLPQDNAPWWAHSFQEYRDVDHDGLIDIVSYWAELNFQSPDTLTGGIAYGHPNGSFQTLIEYPIGTQSFSFSNWTVTAAQLDLDNEAELIYRDGTEEHFEIHEAPGQVAIESIEGLTYASSSSTEIFGVVVRAADLDGDSIDELIFNTTTDQLIVRWSSRPEPDRYERYTHPSLIGEYAIMQPDDFDADGLDDLLIYVKDQSLFMIMVGTGSDTLGGLIPIPMANAVLGDSDRLMLGQLDANPAIDLITPGATPAQLEFVYNFTTPSISEQSLDVGEDVYLVGLVQDIDGSGVDDLVLMRDSLYSNVTAGIVLVRDPSPSGLDLNALEVISPEGSVVSGRTIPPFVYTRDVDLDGDRDLLWTGHISELSWTENRAENPALHQFGVRTLGLPDASAIHVTMLDVDQDGREEAIVSGTLKAHVIDMDTGDLTTINGASGAFMSLPADLDGDGIPELIVPKRIGNQIRVFKLQPDGTLGQRVLINIGDEPGISGFAVADFNNDGRDDFVGASLGESNRIHIYLGDPSEMLIDNGFIQATDLGSANKPTTLDFDHDGNIDLAYSDAELGEIMLYKGLGDGTFEFDASFPSIATNWLIAADLDADGFTDIIGSNNFLDDLEITYLGNNGTVDQQSLLRSFNSVEIIAVDVNADGRLDLATATSQFGTNFSNYDPRVWVQTDDRVFSHFIKLPISDGAGIASSDVNQDGVNDIVVLADGHRQIRVHLGASDAVPCPADLTGDGNLNFFDVSQFLVNQPDYNSDGVFNFFDVAAFISDFSAGCP